MREGQSRDEELEILGRELRRLATPRPPEALVSRVRRLAHLELAGQAEARLDRRLLVFLLLFSWTVSLFAFFAVRLLSGGAFLVSATGSTLSWSLVYVVSAWISSAAGLALLAFHVRREGRPA